jgi:hypothetical protein
MKISLKDYKKENISNDYRVTTISITQQQKSFFENQNINLSSLIRDFLQTLIDQNKVEQNKIEQKKFSAK